MALLKLPQTRSDGIQYIDHRSLYYNKYRYRARFHCLGIYLATWNLTKKDLESRISNNKYKFKNANASIIKKFIDWKNTQVKGKDRINIIRLENNTASVFSNDLNNLKTLESLGCVIEYTEIDDNIPVGIKYFVNEPKYKHRIYLKSKRVSEDFITKLKNMFDRYKGTETKIVPSESLQNWLNDRGTPSLGGWLAWKRSYCSSHFFIDYNDESFITIFALTFDSMISKKYKLEKRPEES